MSGEAYPLSEHDADLLAPPPLSFPDERRDMLQHFDAYVVRNTNPDETIGRLTERQTETFLKVRDFVAGEDRFGVLKLACGYGKSGIAIMTSDALGVGRERANGTRRQTLLNTSRLSIVRQLVSGNVHYDDMDDEVLLSDFSYFAPDVHATVYNGHVKNMSGDTVVMPYPSFDRMLELKPEQLRLFSALLFDECHNLAATRMRALREQDPEGLLIGLSATPGESRNILRSVIDHVPMIDGILKYRFLSDIKMHSLPTGYAFKPQYAGREYAAQDIELLATVGGRNEQIVREAYHNVLMHGPGIVKCHRKTSSGFSHLKTITDMLNDNPPIVTRNGKTRPLRAVAVSGTIKNSYETMHEFLHGDSIDILTFVDIVNEGINLPSIRWALWTPPTKSYRALEQLIGRGLRLDSRDDNKVFHFSQLVDIDLGDYTANAFGWELFDMPRNLEYGFVGNAWGKRGVARPHKPDPAEIVCISGDVPFVGGVVLDGTYETDESRELLALDDMPAAQGFHRIWIKKVLLREGFTEYARVIDGEPRLLYDAAVETFIKDNFVHEDEVTIRRAARAFDVEPRTMCRLLKRYDAPIRSAYAPHPTRIVKHPHVTREDLQRVWEARELKILPVQPNEILLSEVLDRVGLGGNNGARTKYFQDRGFTVDLRRIEHTKPLTKVMIRAEITPWITKYRNAQPLPSKRDYKSIASFSKQTFVEGAFEVKDAFDALRNLGIEPMIFKHTHERRFEYILRSQEEAVTEEIGRVITARLRAPQIQEKAAPVKRKVPKLRIPSPTIDDYEPFDTRGLDIEDTEAIASEAGDASQADERALEATVPLDENHTEPEPRPLARPAGKVYQATEYVSANVLRVFAKRHPHLKESMLTPNGLPLEDSTGFFMEVVNRSVRALPEIPHTWIFVGDIAEKIGMDERTLLRFMMEKNINNAHVRYGEVSGIKGIIAFCSPEFTQFLLARHQGG